MKRIELNKNWILKNETVGTVTATVPGCVHTDLISNGIMTVLFFVTQNFFFNVFDFILNYGVYFLLFMAYAVPLITLFFKKGRPCK